MPKPQLPELGGTAAEGHETSAESKKAANLNGIAAF